MKLTATNVNEVLMKCLFKDGEDTTNHVIGEGVMQNMGFNPERLKNHEADIIDMLSQLPNEFKASGGGGWSFLNACNDINGNQWADLHNTIDELVMLGGAIGKVSFLMPRGMWSTLPGGMPYISIKD